MCIISSLMNEYFKNPKRLMVELTLFKKKSDHVLKRGHDLREFFIPEKN